MNIDRHVRSLVNIHPCFFHARFQVFTLAASCFPYVVEKDGREGNKEIQIVDIFDIRNLSKKGSRLTRKNAQPILHLIGTSMGFIMGI